MHRHPAPVQDPHIRSPSPGLPDGGGRDCSGVRPQLSRTFPSTTSGRDGWSTNVEAALSYNLFPLPHTTRWPHKIVTEEMQNASTRALSSSSGNTRRTLVGGAMAFTMSMDELTRGMGELRAAALAEAATVRSEPGVP